MLPLAVDPRAFVAYAGSAIILSLNLLLLWAYSGIVRVGVKSTPNAEDARGAIALAPTEPPEIARVLRVHANAMASILPFLVLGLIYVLAGAPSMPAHVVFLGFVVARLGHSFAYLWGKQPWRSIFFTLGGVATLALMVMIVMQVMANMHPE